MRMIVNIDVPEIAPAVRFYSEAVGLQLKRMLDDDVAEMTGFSSAIYLLKHPAASRTSAKSQTQRDYSRHWTPVHIDFVVDNVDDAARQAEAAGATRESDCIDWRGSRCITFSDPFGHGFCLIEFAADTYTDLDTDPGTD